MRVYHVYEIYNGKYQHGLGPGDERIYKNENAAREYADTLVDKLLASGWTLDEGYENEPPHFADDGTDSKFFTENDGALTDEIWVDERMVWETEGRW